MNNYLPSLANRMETLKTQIDEYQRVYYRTEIEKREHQASGEVRQVDADDFNNKNVAKKIDLLVELLKELENEARGSSTV